MNQRADAREREFRELFAPVFLQTRAIAGRDCEKEFVIFAVGNRVVDLRAGRERQRFLVDLETEFAGFCESRKIGAESVTQVHHRVDVEIFRQPARLINPRDKA